MVLIEFWGQLATINTATFILCTDIQQRAEISQHRWAH